MEQLDINAVQPGRVLARPVISERGVTLFNAGEELTSGHIAALKQWGFASVTVEPLAALQSGTPPRRSPDQQTPHSQAASSILRTQQPSSRAPGASVAASRNASVITSGDLMQKVHDTVAERFQFLDISHPVIKAIFDLAVERQSRIVLSRPGMAPPRGAVAPAFQTQRPPRVPIKTLLSATHKLGTLPTLFHSLVEMTDSPNASPDSIAKIIAVDPALTARLLRLVNSPFYGLASKVDTISRAVVLVGTRQLIMLAMGATLVTAFRGLPVSLVNMESFWSHSICCGASARLFAQQMKLPQPESFFVAGLLHDIARLLIYTQLPAHALYLLTEARRQQKLVHDLEEETLGFTHEQLGSELMHLWNCPQELGDRILRHHTPVEESSPVESAILPAANMLSQALGYGSSGEIRVSRITPATWQKLGVTPSTILIHCQKLDESILSLRGMLTETGK